MIADCREIARAGGAAVLLVSSACKGLDVAARLAAAGDLPVVAHRAIQHAARKLDLAAPAVRRIPSVPGRGQHAGNRP